MLYALSSGNKIGRFFHAISLRVPSVNQRVYNRNHILGISSAIMFDQNGYVGYKPLICRPSF